MSDPGNFTGLDKKGLRRRLESLTSWQLVAFSVGLLVLAAVVALLL